jgi:hypothetical protein
MATQAAIVRTDIVAPSIHEKVDQDQYNRRYTQKPAQEILAHHALLVVVMPARVPDRLCGRTGEPEDRVAGLR